MLCICSGWLGLVEEHHVWASNVQNTWLCCHDTAADFPTCPVVSGLHMLLGGSSASWWPGGWICLSVCWFWSGGVTLSSRRAGGWRGSGWDGCGHLQCWVLCGPGVCCKCPGGRGGEGRGAPMILSAALTMRCRVFWQDTVQLLYHTVMQLVRMLSVVHMWSSVYISVVCRKVNC